MKIIVFAGGSGTRFWPISRNKFPKQFIPLINNQSTIEMQLGKLSEWYGWNSIFVSTTELLAALVKNTFPALPLTHIVTEPERRDLAPAVGLSMVKLAKMGSGSEPVAILWSDSVIGNTDNFHKALTTAEQFIKDDPERLLFLGEQPQYPNENLGWIEKGEEVEERNGLKIFRKKSFTYRPELKKAQEWFEAGTHLWNPGYFVTTPDFVLDQYRQLQPAMYEQLMQIQKALDTDHENDAIEKIYPEMESISFDDAILELMDNDRNLVLGGDYEWADPGTLYALKQFLQESDGDNVSKGLVYNHDTRDSLVYNFVKKQLVTTIGLDGFIVVNTPDAILVCHKNQIPTIKKMLKEFDGTELEKFL
ncbi:MAG: Alginate biosynthesis protein AlgA [candidate division WS6 bacterium OLB20]|uniref:Alginate biosynthesis protein AlgA n=1 Tax=candidate division WS6 bacterium OLB20 TaxID=1617426 RepID=A0A136LW16_9BACT|nr:MAG: Alginate biosynthesis protein AlgA [candidate division WS6 bacterium OLB20]